MRVLCEYGTGTTQTTAGGTLHRPGGVAPRSVPPPLFYTKLNAVLAEAQFDVFVEDLCAAYYKAGGRTGIPPGTYFRMLFIGYF